MGATRTVVVTGHGADEVEAEAGASGAVFVRQLPQLGTGHAVQQAVPALDDSCPVTLILNGDVPLIRAETARALVQACGGTKLALLTIELPDATGYGRVVRDGESVRAIVEHKDASTAQRSIREVYTGMMAAPTALLTRWVMALQQRQRAAGVLPHRHRRHGGGRGRAGGGQRRRQRDRGARRQQPAAARRPGAAPPAGAGHRR